MKKTLILLSLLIASQFSILSQNITVVKTNAHTYANDSLVCLDPIAARRVMYERTEHINTIAEQQMTIHILDSVAYYRGIERDSLQQDNWRLYDSWKLSENTRIGESMRLKADAKPYKVLTYVGFALAFLLGITKL